MYGSARARGCNSLAPLTQDLAAVAGIPLGSLLGPIFNVVFLCLHCSHVRKVVTIAAKYAKRLGVNVFEVSFLAYMANCNGMVAVGTDE